MNESDHNFHSSYTNIIVFSAMVVVAIIMRLAMFYEPHEENNKPVKTEYESPYITETEPPAESPTIKSAGFYPESVYVIGDKSAPDEYYMPAGYYIIIAKDKYDYSATWDIVNESKNSDDIIYSSFQHSNIVKVADGQILNMDICDAYSLDTFDSYGIENSPFEHSGMFRVGTDVPAGTYRIVPENDQHYESWAVHENIDTIDYEKIHRNPYDKTAGNIEVTVEDGNILELFYCRLEKN